MSVRRHLQVFGEAHAAARKNERVIRARENSDFLPAVLEVLETPPNPIGRAVLWVVMSFLTFALLWACFGQIDVVATAQGRVIPDGRTKTVQAPDQGIVRTIFVEEGESVSAGQPLLELDSTVSGAEVDRAAVALRVAEIDRARAKALLAFSDAMDAGDASWPPTQRVETLFDPPDGMDEDEIAAQRAAIAARVRQFEAQHAGLVQEQLERASELVMAATDVSRIEQQLPLVEQQLASIRSLEERGFAPRLRVAEVEEHTIGVRQDLIKQREELSRTEAAQQAAIRRVSEAEAAFRREALDAYNEADAVAQARREELTIAAERDRHMVLTAPTDGVVQQLQVHTIGAVVRPADPILTVVPRDSTLVVEAMILNRDVGFVREGQTVRVKLEAFPFTRYGVVGGRLAVVSRDAVQDEQLGLVFPVRIELSQFAIKDGEGLRPLSPGMSVSAEVMTGRRRIIEFLLSPLARRVEEAGRER